MADNDTPNLAPPARVVLVDTNGKIIGSLPVTIADNGDFALGSVADAAWVSGNGTAIALLKTIASGGGGGSGPVTIVDGGDVAEGAKADAAVVTDTTGTVSGKLRGLVKWAFERMPAALGQATSANSLPVVLPAAQITALTPPAAIDGFALDATVLAGNVVLEDIDVDVEAVTTALTAVTKSEDAASVTGDSGVVLLAVRQDDERASATSADGDYAVPVTDRHGRLRLADDALIRMLAQIRDTMEETNAYLRKAEF